VNGDVFKAFVEQVLTPKLKSGKVGVMDNLASPKRPRTRTLMESTGAGGIFLPPYSPDLKPIENVFAKIKPLLRSLACRSRDVLWPAMQLVLDQLTPTEAANCFRHCGYPLQMD